LRALGKPRSIRSRLITLVFASLLPVLVFAAVMLVLVERQQRTLLERSYRETARALTVAVDRELMSSVFALEALATSHHLDGGDLRSFYDQAQRMVGALRGWRTITLYDDSGQLQLLDLLRPYGIPLPIAAEVPAIRRVLDTNAAAISDLFGGPVSSKALVAVAVPVIRGGRLRYVLGARIRVQRLSRVLSEVLLPPDSVATVIDRQGIIVARTRRIDELLGKSATPKFVTLSRSAPPDGSFQDVTLDGVFVYSAYSRSQLSGWTVGVGVPGTTVDAPLRTSLVWVGGGGLVLLTIGGGLAVVFGQRVAGEVTSLAASAQALGRSEAPPARSTSFVTEVAHVEAAMAEAARQREAAIAARRQSEEDLAESEERTRFIVDNALDAVITIDVGGRITSWNPQAEALFGWSRDEVVGRRLSDTIVPPRYRGAHEEGLTRFRETGETTILDRRIELVALRRDGTEFPVEVAVTQLPLRDAPIFSAFLRDISERKRSERGIAKYAERLEVLHEIDRAIIAADAPVAIAEAALLRLRDLLGVPRVSVNLFDLAAGEAEWLAAVGRRRSHLGPGVRFSMRLMGDLEGLRRGEVQIIDAAAQPRSPEIDALLASGVLVYMVVPMFAAGELIGGLSFGGTPREFPTEQVSIAREAATQIAIAIEQARLRDRVTAAEQQYREVFENVVEGIFRSTREGGHVLVNPAMAKICGYASPEDMTASVADIERQLYVDPQDRRTLLRLLDQHGAISRYECRFHRKDGTVIWVSQSAREVRDEVGRLLYYDGILEDITERKLSEAAAGESEERFRATFEQAAVGIGHTTTDGRWLRINQRLCDIVGYSREELLYHSFLDITHPDDVSIDLALTRRLLANEIKTISREKRYVHKNGSTVWVDLTVSLVWDPSGDPKYFIAVVQDITERKRLEEELLHTQRMEGVGQLASGIAHDFNNLLTVIGGRAELALRILSPTDPLWRHLDLIHKTATRAAGLTQRLLALSRKQVLQPKVLNMNELVGNSTNLLEGLIGEDIDLVFEPAADTGQVRADSGQLEQVIVNLAVNARDAMPEGGRLTIETASVVLDSDYATRHIDVTPGAYVMLAVSDTGRGMDRALQARIFEPFFTTKGPGKGTGLGLASVYGIVKQSGGHIRVYSEPGMGTVFRIYLPRTDAAPEPAAASGTTGALPRGTETVLLVEDDEEVRSFARDLLEQLGYTVLEALSAADALLIAERHTGLLSLLLTDVVMPGMGGQALALRIAEVRPETRTVFMSGYTDDTIVRHGVLELGIDFLAKPLTTDGLAGKVREVLDRPV
jgi:PAS domain S-box-containing protein